MNKNTIGNYFRQNDSEKKRPRAKSSPELVKTEHKKRATGSKMGEQGNIEIMLNQLETRLCEAMDKKLSFLATKEDVSDLLNQVKELSVENRELREEVKALKLKNDLVLRRVENLENRSRRNNLIFRGLNYDCETADYAEIVRDFCVGHLGAREEIWVNRAHALGRRVNNGPIIAHFPNDRDIQYITRNSKKLKGTRFVIHKDFASDTRKKRSRMFRACRELRRRVPDVRASVEVDRLIVNGHGFTMDEGERLVAAGGGDGWHKLQDMLGGGVMQAVRSVFEEEATRAEADADANVN